MRGSGEDHSVDWQVVHLSVTKIVPLDTVRLVRPMTDDDKERQGSH